MSFIRVSDPAGLVAVTSGAWTAIPSAEWYDYVMVVLSHASASQSAILDIYGRDENEVAFPMLLADSLAVAEQQTITAGAIQIGGAGNYYCSEVLILGPAKDIYIQEDTGPAAGTEGTEYNYYVGGVFHRR
tara:strand:- start:16 stop:408 length:393 start_codon:yes stop_codon:yes gene_type:complete